MGFASVKNERFQHVGLGPQSKVLGGPLQKAPGLARPSTLGGQLLGRRVGGLWEAPGTPVGGPACCEGPAFCWGGS